MSKAHRHAELMKFAADHWHEAEWRRRDIVLWTCFTFNSPTWQENVDYEVRLIRPTATQPRREVPAPETEAPKIGTTYWVADPTVSARASQYVWENNSVDREWLAADLVYLNKEDRDARVAAMLEIER